MELHHGGPPRPTINALGFDLLDGVAGWSTTELLRVQGVWQQVAEDFAPFDLDVTTEAPAASALIRSNSSGSDMVFGTTVRFLIL